MSSLRRLCAGAVVLMLLVSTAMPFDVSATTCGTGSNITFTDIGGGQCRGYLTTPAIGDLGDGGWAGSTSSSVSLNRSVTIASGDLLVMFASVQDSNGLSTIATPSGWTAITNVVSTTAYSGAYAHLYAFYKVAGGSESSSYSVSASAGSGSTIYGVDGNIRTYSGTATSIPIINAYASSGVFSAGVVTVPALSETFVPGELYVGATAAVSNSLPTTFTFPLSDVFTRISTGNSSHDGSESYYIGDTLPDAAPGSETYGAWNGTGAATGDTAIGFTILPPSASTFTVPTDWTATGNTIEVIGGGGGGGGTGYNLNQTGGGGGGGYSEISNVTMSGTLYFSVGAGGGGGGSVSVPADGIVGGDTWLRIDGTDAAPSTSGQGVLAKGGTGGQAAAVGGIGGGQTGNTGGVGTVLHLGGSGGTPSNNSWSGAGGGGAGGPRGNGGTGGTDDGTNDTGGSGGGGAGGGGSGTNGAAGTEATGGQVAGTAGGNNAAGSGSGAGGATITNGTSGSNGGGGGGGGSTNSSNQAAGNGALGGAGTDWGSNGAGGGGGGGGGNAAGGTPGTSGAGGAGGGYGGGGGGGGDDTVSIANSGVGGAGAQGIIVITYTPAGGGSTGRVIRLIGGLRLIGGVRLQ